MTTIEEPAEIKAVWELPQRMGLTADLERLHAFLTAWVQATDPEVRMMIETQLSGRAKYFRPVTIFACHRSMVDESPSEEVLTAAAGLELLHNVSLIIDDILDRSRYRRGKLAAALPLRFFACADDLWLHHLSHLAPGSYRSLFGTSAGRTDAASRRSGVPAVEIAKARARHGRLADDCGRRHGFHVRDLCAARHARQSPAEVRQASRHSLSRLR